MKHGHELDFFYSDRNRYILSPCHTYTFWHGVCTATMKNYEDVVWTPGTA